MLKMSRASAIHNVAQAPPSNAIGEMHHGRSNAEIETLKNTIKMLNLEHKVEILEKEKEIQEKEIHILKLENEKKILNAEKENEMAILNVDNENKITILKAENEKKILELENERKILNAENEKRTLELENEIKVLKLKDENVQPINWNERSGQLIPNEMYLNNNDLVVKGINMYFLGEAQNDFFFHSYERWFDAMQTRAYQNNFFVMENFVVVKVRCSNPKRIYKFYSSKQNGFRIQETWLNIMDKAWNHDTSKVLILHPSQVNKCLQMNEGIGNNYLWFVNSIPDEYIGQDWCHFVLCLKK